MLHPLAGVIEKLRRADEHLITLYNETVRYVDERPHALFMYRDTGDGKPGFVFRILKEPPLHLSVVIGDIVQNMRSALDYIAHELTVANGQKPGRRTQFPVSLDEDDFLNQAISQGKIHTISMRALKIVSLLQPYRDEDPDSRRNHPLHLLTKLSNMDKHHALALCAFAGQATAVFTHPDGRQFTSEFRDKLHDGAVMCAMPADFFHEKIKTHFKGETTITFMDSGFRDREALATLQGIRYFMGEAVLRAIERLFDPLPDDLRLKTHGLPDELRQVKDRGISHSDLPFET